MTDRYDEMRVAPDPAKAEELRRHLHAHLTRSSAHDDGVEVVRMADLVSSATPVARGLTPRVRLAMAAAGIVALVTAGIAVRSLTSGDKEEPLVTTARPVDAPAAVHTLVAAINTGDVDAFIDAFTPDGTIRPRGTFDESRWYGFGGPPKLGVDEVPLVEAWFAIDAAWRVQVELRSCAPPVPARGIDDGIDESVECEVATRWRALSLEITEVWDVDLRGDEVVSWGASGDVEDLDQLELDPSDRALPLGYSGLEEWEDWLATNHPEDAAAWLNPRLTEQSIVDEIADPELAARVAPLFTSARRSWVIEGHEFTPLGLIPYDPAFADDIEASIREYLEER